MLEDPPPKLKYFTILFPFANEFYHKIVIKFKGIYFEINVYSDLLQFSQLKTTLQVYLKDILF